MPTPTQIRNAIPPATTQPGQGGPLLGLAAPPAPTTVIVPVQASIAEAVLLTVKMYQVLNPRYIDTQGIPLQLLLQPTISSLGYAHCGNYRAVSRQLLTDSSTAFQNMIFLSDSDTNLFGIKFSVFESLTDILAIPVTLFASNTNIHTCYDGAPGTTPRNMISFVPAQLQRIQNDRFGSGFLITTRGVLGNNLGVGSERLEA